MNMRGFTIFSTETTSFAESLTRTEKIPTVVRTGAYKRILILSPREFERVDDMVILSMRQVEEILHRQLQWPNSTTDLRLCAPSLPVERLELVSNKLLSAKSSTEGQSNMSERA